jgi:hypothetical protein
MDATQRQKATRKILELTKNPELASIARHLLCERDDASVVDNSKSGWKLWDTKKDLLLFSMGCGLPYLVETVWGHEWGLYCAIVFVALAFWFGYQVLIHERKIKSFWSVLAAAILVASSVFSVVLITNRSLGHQIHFRKDPEFSLVRQFLIRHKVVSVREYLDELEIPVPAKLPPFTVGVGESVRNDPIERLGDLHLDRNKLGDSGEIAAAYMRYVIMRDTNSIYQNADLQELAADPFFAQKGEIDIAITWYLTSSYVGTEQSDFPISRLLWKIREQLGVSFTDSLVSNMLLNTIDTPRDGFRADIHDSLKNLLWNADSTLENDHQHWPEIQNVLNDYTFTQQ